MTTTRTLSVLPTVVSFTPSSSTSAAAFVVRNAQFTAPAHLTVNLCNAPDGYNQSRTTLLTASTNTSIYYPSSQTWGGFANLTVPAVNDGSDLTVLVSTPESSSSTNWAFEVGISLESTAWHTLDRLPLFAFDDSDNTSALLTSPTYSSRILKQPPSYELYAVPDAQVRAGLVNSTCYIRSLQTVPASRINQTTTTRGVYELSEEEGGLVNETLRQGRREQFTLQGLNPFTNYSVWGFQPESRLIAGNMTASRLFRQQWFSTKRTASNCRLVSDLAFCPNVAYSVPAPPTMETNLLMSLYDNATTEALAGFNTTLSLFSCDEPVRSVQGMYSYVRTCSQCREAYRSWVCAMTMPRCVDEDERASMNDTDPDKAITTFPRASANDSRTPFLPAAAFPYTELPPCVDVCELVYASCPPIISKAFGCPLPTITMEQSYGVPYTEQMTFANIEGGNDAAFLTRELDHIDAATRARDRFGNVRCNDMGTIALVTRRRWSGPGNASAASGRHERHILSIAWTLVAVLLCIL